MGKLLGGKEFHGMSHTKIYKRWHGMISRCLSKKAVNYNWYGGKGVQVCDDWLSFDKFYEWAMENGFTDDSWLEREDKSGDYYPENCKFVKRKKFLSKSFQSEFLPLIKRTQKLILSNKHSKDNVIAMANWLEDTIRHASCIASTQNLNR